jgi:hypothetical protein
VACSGREAVEQRAGEAWRRQQRKNSCGLGFRGKAAAAAWGKPRARGRRLYRVAEVPWRAALRRRAGRSALDCGRTRARVRAWRGEMEGPDRRDPHASEMGREGRGRRGQFGPGRERAGWAARKEGKEEAGRAGPAGLCGKEGKEKEKEKREWAGPKEEK